MKETENDQIDKGIVLQDVACIIPIFNIDKDTILSCLQKLPDRISEVYLVLNDESFSIRSLLLNNIKQELFILQLPFQVGKLEAFRYGIEQIINNTKCNILSQTDGRLKQPPEELIFLIDHLEMYNYAMVIADRYTNQNLIGQPHRIAIHRMLSAIIKTITPYKLIDVACGTRVYKLDLAKKFLNLRGFGYSMEIEQLLICAINNMEVCSVPVNSNRQYNSTNAEKIEDILYLLLSYCNDLQVSIKVRQCFSYMLLMIKKRRDFKIDLSIFNEIGSILWKYSGNDFNDIRGMYTAQIPGDSYNLYLDS